MAPILLQNKAIVCWLEVAKYKISVGLKLHHKTCNSVLADMQFMLLHTIHGGLY